MDKKRVFVSFDVDNDRSLKVFINSQAKLPDSPLEIVDTSLKETAPMMSWREKTRATIKRSELVLVLVGRNTHKASGVLNEVQMAKDEAKPIIQMVGYKDGTFPAVPNAGRLYAWSWENLKKLLEPRMPADPA